MFFSMQKGIFSRRFFEVLLFLFFLAFLLFLYFNNFTVQNDIMFDKEKLKSILSNYDFSTSRIFFCYFLIGFLLLIFGFIFVFSKRIKEIDFNNLLVYGKGGDFYLAFFSYFLLQILFKSLGFSFVDSFFHSKVIFYYKFVIIFSAIFFNPIFFILILNFFKIFDVFNFFKSLFYRMFVDYKFFVFLSFVVFLLVLSLIPHVEDNLLVVYVKYSNFYEMLFAFLGLVFFIPLVEELIFRKYLIDYLLNIFRIKLLAVIFSSFVFSVIHFENIFYSFLIFVVGCFLGTIYLGKKDIAYTYFFHSFYNFLVFCYWVYFS